MSGTSSVQNPAPRDSQTINDSKFYKDKAVKTYILEFTYNYNLNNLV